MEYLMGKIIKKTKFVGLYTVYTLIDWSFLKVSLIKEKYEPSLINITIK